MGIMRGRTSHLRFIRESRYSTKSSIKKYVANVWLKNAEKYYEKEQMNLKFRMRIDSKYIAILIVGRKHKNIFAFIDRETGAILRPRNNRRPHTRYQPKKISSNINNKDGGAKYYKNLKFHYLP